MQRYDAIDLCIPTGKSLLRRNEASQNSIEICIAQSGGCLSYVEVRPHIPLLVEHKGWQAMCVYYVLLYSNLLSFSSGSLHDHRGGSYIVHRPSTGLLRLIVVYGVRSRLDHQTMYHSHEMWFCRGVLRYLLPENMTYCPVTI